MTAYEKLGVFYLGKAFRHGLGETSENCSSMIPRIHDHAVIIGMTAAAKKASPLGLLEEALSTTSGDRYRPKGDLPNLLLPESFGR